MERILVRFIGAGVQLFARGLGVDAAPGAISKGYAFVEQLVAADAAAVNPVVVGAARSMWSHWRAARLQPAVVAEQLETLIPLLETYGPDRHAITIAFAAAAGSTGISNSRCMIAAQKLAAHIIDQASRAGAFDNQRINRSVCFLLLEGLFGHLLAERRILRDMKFAIEKATAEMQRSQVPLRAAIAA